MSGLGIGGLFLQIGGAASSAIGSYYSAATQKINLKAQADLADINTKIANIGFETQASIADTNARIAELGAQSALLQGQQQVGALTLNAGRLKSRQRATMAANGIDLGTGNAAEIQASTDTMTEIDRNTLEANAVRSAWGMRTQATNYQNEAMAARASKRPSLPSVTSAISPFASFSSSLMGSAGSVAGSWYQFSKEK